MSTLLARWCLPGLLEPVRPMHTFALWLQRHQREGQPLWIEAHRGKRSLGQNAKFHALCGDLEKSALTWNGRRRSLGEWKHLLVSGHAFATADEGSTSALGELARGLEGELVYLRESTAHMPGPRKTSLIEYAIAFCVAHDIALSDPNEALAAGLGYAVSLPAPQPPLLLLEGPSHA